jgi:DNA repair protein RecO (recombination protein O)
MLFHTKGIVLRSVKYGETSLITKIYTAHYGLQSYIIKGVRSPKSKLKAGILQPLTLLDLEAYHRENKNLQHVKEAGTAYIFTDLPFNIAKSSIGIFIIEILLQVIKEEEQNEALFDYLFKTIMELDKATTGLKTFHLRFLISLSRFLGFFPSGIYSAEKKYFDLQNGLFVSSMPTGTPSISDNHAELFSTALIAVSTRQPMPNLDNNSRKELLQNLLTYYSLHVANFKMVRSVKILEDVLRG